MSEAAALAECREMIRVGSKSFSLASRLFSPEIRDAACFLYGWCRFCDDQIDGAVSSAEQRERLAELRRLTSLCFKSSLSEEERRELVLKPVFTALRVVAGRYGIPERPALELLDGMEMDAVGTRYRSWQDLELYCHRVAGTVGLMMAHVMGVRGSGQEEALQCARSLGIAMQMTNIARDIREDAELGRIYLPKALLAENWSDAAAVTPGLLLSQANRPRLVASVRRLLSEASFHYERGRAGLRALSFRSALAVATAAEVYSEIGLRVLARGERAWETRTVVSPARKLLCIARALARVLFAGAFKARTPQVVSDG